MSIFIRICEIMLSTAVKDTKAKKTTRKVSVEKETLMEGIPRRTNKFLQFHKRDGGMKYYTLETGLNEEEFVNSVKDMQKFHLGVRLTRIEVHVIRKFPMNQDMEEVHSTVGGFACPNTFMPETFADFFGPECEYYPIEFKNKTY